MNTCDPAEGRQIGVLSVSPLHSLSRAHTRTRTHSYETLVHCFFRHLAEFCIQSKACRSKTKHADVKTMYQSSPFHEMKQTSAQTFSFTTSIHVPMNTKIVPIHCMLDITFPNRSTEPRMVKNFRVVVMMEQVRGPKYTTVMKIKVWGTTDRRIQRQLHQPVVMNSFLAKKNIPFTVSRLY